MINQVILPFSSIYKRDSMITTPRKWSLDTKFSYPEGITDTDNHYTVCLNNKLYIIHPKGSYIYIYNLQTNIYEPSVQLDWSGLTSGNVICACVYDNDKIFIFGMSNSDSTNRTYGTLSFNTTNNVVSTLAAIAVGGSPGGTFAYSTVHYSKKHNKIFIAFSGKFSSPTRIIIATYNIPSNTWDLPYYDNPKSWNEMEYNMVQEDIENNKIYYTDGVVPSVRNIFDINTKTVTHETTGVLGERTRSDNFELFGTPVVLAGTVMCLYDIINNRVTKLDMPNFPGNAPPIGRSFMWNSRFCITHSTGIYYLPFTTIQAGDTPLVYKILQGQTFNGLRDLQVGDVLITSTPQVADRDIEIHLGEYDTNDPYYLLVQDYDDVPNTVQYQHFYQ